MVVMVYIETLHQILVAMDYNICHEIYRSGYAFQTSCLFKTMVKKFLYEKHFMKLLKSL